MNVQFIQTVHTIWQREVIRYWRDKARIFGSLLQPLMFLAIFGTGLRQTLAAGDFGVDYVKFMYPGIIAMSVMGVSFFSTISTVWDREFGFLKEILVAPVSRTAIAIGKTLGAMTIACLQAAILLAMSPLLSATIHAAALPSLIFFIVLLSFAISGMGLLIASLMKTTESFGFLMQILIFPMFFLSGAFFPLTAVPTWMSILSKISPLTYGVDALRQAVLNSQVPQVLLEKLVLHTPAVDAAYLIAFSAVMVTAAVVAFNKRE